MIRSSLTSLLSLFQSGTQQSQQDVFNEATLMILARATSTDSNINRAEVSTVQEKVKETTGEEVTAADIRVAANSKLYEEAPLERYLVRTNRILSVEQKLSILNALVSVIKSDQKITNREVVFFNAIATAFGITPADVLGLRVSS